MKYKIILLASFFIFLPLAASADVSLFPAGYWGPLVPACAPNCNICDMFSSAQMVIYFVMTLTLFVVGPIMVTVGGLFMLVAGGNEERFSSGKKMATGAVIGILIALVAFLIVNTLLATIAKQISGFSGSGFTITCNARSPFVPFQQQNTGGQNNYTDPSVPSTSSNNFGGQQYQETQQTEPGGMTDTF